MTDGGPWRGPSRGEWVTRFAFRILGDDELIPPPPLGYQIHRVGLTAHLRERATMGPMLCGTQVGSPPRGEPVGICLDCWAGAMGYAPPDSTAGDGVA